MWSEWNKTDWYRAAFDFSLPLVCQRVSETGAWILTLVLHTEWLPAICEKPRVKFEILALLAQNMYGIAITACVGPEARQAY